MTVTCVERDAGGVPAIVPCMVGGEAATDAHAAELGASLEVHWLGRIAYRDAWDLQKRLAAARASGVIGDQLARAVVRHLAATLHAQHLDLAGGKLGGGGEDVRGVGLAPQREHGGVLEEEQLIGDHAARTGGG